MFDIGFQELLLIGIVGLLVLGPERLPGAVRTGSAWLGKIRRGFSDIKREIELELHNDEVMRELKKTRDQLQGEAADLEQEGRSKIQSLENDIAPPPSSPSSSPSATDENKA